MSDIPINHESFTNFLDKQVILCKGLLEDYIGEEVTTGKINTEIILETVLRDRMSFILLSSKTFNIIFRCFFDNSRLLKKAAEVVGMETEDADAKLVQDFMNEFCNLVAGSMKSMLLNNYKNETIGISIPIVVSGFESLYFGVHKKDTNYFYWSHENDDLEIICSIELEALRGFDKEIINNLMESADNEEDYFDF